MAIFDVEEYFKERMLSRKPKPQSDLSRISKSLSSGFVEGRDIFHKEKTAHGNELDSTYTALVNLLQVSDNEYSLDNLDKNLNKFENDAN